MGNSTAVTAPTTFLGSLLYKKITTKTTMYLHIYSSKTDLVVSLINGDKFPRPDENSLYVELPAGVSFRIDKLHLSDNPRHVGEPMFDVIVTMPFDLSNDTPVYHEVDGKIRKTTLDEAARKLGRVYEDLQDTITIKPDGYYIDDGVSLRIHDLTLIRPSVNADYKNRDYLDYPAKLNRSKFAVEALQ